MSFNWKDPERAPEEKRAEHWDKMSVGFDGFERQTADNNHIIRFLENRGMVSSDMRVLDIGCAAGKYSLYFAEHCKEVVGTDISPEMIRKAEANSERLGFKNTRFIRSDWENLNLEEIGGEHSFDLIFANMTPAISSEADLRKLLLAARGWCFFGGLAKGTRLLGDKISELFSLSNHGRGNSRSIPYVFSQLWEEGIRPNLDYLKTQSSHDRPLDEAVEHYSKTFGSMVEMNQGSPFSEAQQRKLAELLKNEAVNGIVHEEFKSTSAVISWNMKDI